MAEITNPTIDSRHGLVVNFDGENFQDYEKVTLDYRPYRNFKSFLLPLINAATSKKKISRIFWKTPMTIGLCIFIYFKDCGL